MTKINDFKNNFNEKYFNIINSNIGVMIESFIEFYGKKYREKITEILDSVNIVTFLPYSTKEICTNVIPELIAVEFIDATAEIFNILELPKLTKIEYLRTKFLIKDSTPIEVPTAIGIYDENNKIVDKILETIFGNTKLFSYDYSNNALYNFSSYDEKKQKDIIKTIFNSDIITPDIIKKIQDVKTYMDYKMLKTNGYEKYINASNFYSIYKDYQKNPSILKRIIGTTNNIIPSAFKTLTDNPCMINNLDGKYIALPIFFTNDEHFIHELNHAITTNVLMIICDDKTNFAVEKSGIETLNTKDEEQMSKEKNKCEYILHELLNDRMAQDISEIFHNNGGTILDETNTYDIPVKMPYRIMLPLIEDFYQEYKELIKEASISENQKLLYSQIDKKTLQDFSEFINKTYIEILNSDETELTQEQLDKAAYYTERLQRKPHTEVSPEDYLILLEMDRHKVTYLHHHDDDNQPKVLAKAKKRNNP